MVGRKTAEPPAGAEVVELEGGDRRWVEYVPLGEVVPADDNPKDHDADLLDGSVRDFGFVEPPQLDERTGKLIAGHGRIEALQRAEANGPPEGYEGAWPPEGVAVDHREGRWYLPVVRGWASRDDMQAKAYLIVANQSTIKPGWKPRPLAEFLHDLEQGAVQLERLGFDEAGYDMLLQETGLKGELEGDFLKDLDGGEPGSGPGVNRRQGATDVVDLRLPMKDRDRDDAVSLLRKHQRTLSDLGRPAGSLSETALEVIRTWRPE
jgi:hypothetical protein